MRLLCHRIGPRKDRTRFALAKVQLSEEALTLPYAQLNLPVLFKPPRQRLAVPQVNRHTVFAGTLPKNPIQLLQFPFTQTGGSAPPWAFGQTAQPVLIKTLHPILHRARTVAKITGHLMGAQPLGHQ